MTDSQLLAILAVAVAAGAFLYLVPTFFAVMRRCQSVWAILVLNLFLGWSFFGWVGALVWALAGAQRPPPPERQGGTLRESQAPARSLPLVLASFAAAALLAASAVAYARIAAESWSATYEQVAFGLSFKTVISVTKTGGLSRDDVVVEVEGETVDLNGRRRPGTWKTKALSITDEQPLRVVSEMLFDPAGATAPYAIEPRLVTIIDRDGENLAQVKPASAKIGSR